MGEPRVLGYREIPAPAALAPWVECLWWHGRAPGEATEATPILPDGRIDVVWSQTTGALVAGPQTRPLARPFAGAFLAFGVRFRPGAAAAVLGVAVEELADAHVPLDAIDGRLSSLLDERLAGVGGPADALRSLSSLLAARRAALRAPDPVVAAAVAALGRHPARISEIARCVALSERQLQRRFREHVGYGPKTLQRVLRFQRALRGLATGDAASRDLAWHAAAAGYADQAHLTREVHALSGLTPLQLRSRAG
jgi:AraC-like DNA-binding protein